MKRFKKHDYSVYAHIDGKCEVFANNFKAGITRVYTCVSTHFSDELRSDNISDTRWDELRRQIMRNARSAQRFHNLSDPERLKLGWTYNPYRPCEGVKVYK